MDGSTDRAHRAKSYQRIKQRTALFHLFWTPALLAAFILTPASSALKDYALGLTGHPYLGLAVYFSLFSLIFLVLDLPLAYYSGFVVEHRYGLSNQTLGGWAAFFAKRALLSFFLSLVLLSALYYLIWNHPGSWWIMAWGGYAAVSYVLGKLFPTLIVPLFYKYDPIQDEALRKRVFDLSAKYGMPVENLYSLNLSKTTKKANAAFMGIGKTKRVVLSDTLLEHFTHDEIETVVAHELGHFKHGDIYKGLVFGLLSSFAAFGIAAAVFDRLAVNAGFSGSGDIGALPLLFLIFYLFSLVLTPAQSAFSRKMEWAADRFSLTAFPYPQIFISCMRKLGEVNLADPDPHPLYEWFFYDHPSIGRRIKMAERWKASS